MAKIVKLNTPGKAKGRPKKGNNREDKMLEDLYFSGSYDGPDMTARQLYDKIKGIKDYHGAGKKPYRVLSVSPKEVVIRDKRTGEEMTILMMEFFDALSLGLNERTVKNLKENMPLKHASAVAALFWYIADKEKWGAVRDLIDEMFHGLNKK